MSGSKDNGVGSWPAEWGGAKKKAFPSTIVAVQEDGRTDAAVLCAKRFFTKQSQWIGAIADSSLPGLRHVAVRGDILPRGVETAVVSDIKTIGDFPLYRKVQPRSIFEALARNLHVEHVSLYERLPKDSLKCLLVALAAWSRPWLEARAAGQEARPSLPALQFLEILPSSGGSNALRLLTEALPHCPSLQRLEFVEEHPKGVPDLFAAVAEHPGVSDVPLSVVIHRPPHAASPGAELATGTAALLTAIAAAGEARPLRHISVPMCFSEGADEADKYKSLAAIPHTELFGCVSWLGRGDSIPGRRNYQAQVQATHQKPTFPQKLAQALNSPQCGIRGLELDVPAEASIVPVAVRELQACRRLTTLHLRGCLHPRDADRCAAAGKALGEHPTLTTLVVHTEPTVIAPLSSPSQWQERQPGTWQSRLGGDGSGWVAFARGLAASKSLEEVQFLSGQADRVLARRSFGAEIAAELLRSPALPLKKLWVDQPLFARHEPGQYAWGHAGLGNVQPARIPDVAATETDPVRRVPVPCELPRDAPAIAAACQELASLVLAHRTLQSLLLYAGCSQARFFGGHAANDAALLYGDTTAEHLFLPILERQTRLRHLLAFSPTSMAGFALGGDSYQQAHGARSDPKPPQAMSDAWSERLMVAAERSTGLLLTLRAVPPAVGSGSHKLPVYKLAKRQWAIERCGEARVAARRQLVLWRWVHNRRAYWRRRRIKRPVGIAPIKPADLPLPEMEAAPTADNASDAVSVLLPDLTPALQARVAGGGRATGPVYMWQASCFQPIAALQQFLDRTAEDGGRAALASTLGRSLPPGKIDPKTAATVLGRVQLAPKPCPAGHRAAIYTSVVASPLVSSLALLQEAPLPARVCEAVCKAAKARASNGGLPLSLTIGQRSVGQLAAAINSGGVDELCVACGWQSLAPEVYSDLSTKGLRSVVISGRRAVYRCYYGSAQDDDTWGGIMDPLPADRLAAVLREASRAGSRLEAVNMHTCVTDGAATKTVTAAISAIGAGSKLRSLRGLVWRHAAVPGDVTPQYIGGQPQKRMQVCELPGGDKQAFPALICQAVRDSPLADLGIEAQPVHGFGQLLAAQLCTVANLRSLQLGSIVNACDEAGCDQVGAALAAHPSLEELDVLLEPRRMHQKVRGSKAIRQRSKIVAPLVVTAMTHGPGGIALANTSGADYIKTSLGAVRFARAVVASGRLRKLTLRTVEDASPVGAQVATAVLTHPGAGGLEQLRVLMPFTTLTPEQVTPEVAEACRAVNEQTGAWSGTQKAGEFEPCLVPYATVRLLKTFSDALGKHTSLRKLQLFPMSTYTANKAEMAMWRLVVPGFKACRSLRWLSLLAHDPSFAQWQRIDHTVVNQQAKLQPATCQAILTALEQRGGEKFEHLQLLPPMSREVKSKKKQWDVEQRCRALRLPLPLVVNPSLRAGESAVPVPAAEAGCKPSQARGRRRGRGRAAAAGAGADEDSGDDNWMADEEEDEEEEEEEEEEESAPPRRRAARSRHARAAAAKKEEEEEEEGEEEGDDDADVAMGEGEAAAGGPAVGEWSMLAGVHPSWHAAIAGAKAGRGRATPQAAIEAAVAATPRESIVPRPDRIMRALALSLSDVRVCILSQEPYRSAEQADGLAFSTGSSARAPSLTNILREVSADTGAELNAFVGTSLAGWAAQGVLLLNSVLSLDTADLPSHRKAGWPKVVQALLEALAEDSRRAGRTTVFLVWGTPARKLVEKAGITDDDGGHIRVLSTVHPSPLSAKKGFFGCKHFSKANELLAAAGRPVVDWSCLATPPAGTEPFPEACVAAPAAGRKRRQPPRRRQATKAAAATKEEEEEVEEEEEEEEEEVAEPALRRRRSTRRR